MSYVTRFRACPSVLSEVVDQQVPLPVPVKAGVMSPRGLERNTEDRRNDGT